MDSDVLTGEAIRHSFDVTGAHAIVGACSALIAVLCVLVHYEGMSFLSRLLPRISLPRRSRIVVLILGMLIVHIVEVWIFALSYLVLDYWPALGGVRGVFEEGALDFVYFSVVTYSSLGFGDLVPHGAIRILTGTETLLGLSLITWTASFAFLEMQRDWPEFRRPRRR